jgi:hypothetical protein
MLVFPSMPKGDIVGQLVVIDVNPWRVILEIDVNPWRLMSTLGEVRSPKDVDKIIGQLVIICMIEVD